MALPDGPKASSVWQMLQWILRPFLFLRACHRQYGDCFTIRLGKSRGTLVLFSHPQALYRIETPSYNDVTQFEMSHLRMPRLKFDGTIMLYVLLALAALLLFAIGMWHFLYDS